MNEARLDDLEERWLNRHIVRIADGSRVNLPNSEELKERFAIPNTSAGPGFYLQAWLVTLINSTSGQPIAASVGCHKEDSERKTIVFATNLLDEQTYSNASIRELYRKRWGVETAYDRIKNLLHLDKFHARSYNGVMQEIFASLLIVSLASAVDIEAEKRAGIDRTKSAPNFKAVVHVVRRYFSVLATIDKLTKKKTIEHADAMIEEAKLILYKNGQDEITRVFPNSPLNATTSANGRSSTNMKSHENENESLIRTPLELSAETRNRWSGTLSDRRHKFISYGNI